MKEVFTALQWAQRPSGEFPTTVTTQEGEELWASTICPTYLIAVILTTIQMRYYSTPQLESIILKCLYFLHARSSQDPRDKWVSWRFNMFYPPDWEETAWCLWLMHHHRIFTLDRILPTLDLLCANESQSNGVGVWLKDPYSDNNCEHNAFDPIVQGSVLHLLHATNTHHILPVTQEVFLRDVAAETPSLYYTKPFQKFMYWLMGLGPKPKSFLKNAHLFHNHRRPRLRYSSDEVILAANLLLSLAT